MALGRNRPRTDEQGQPIEGVSLRAHCGYGTLRQTGSTRDRQNGRYTLRFGPGMRTASEKPGEVPVNLQAATISASKPGFVEKNLSRQGHLTMANRLPPPDYPKWGEAGGPVLPNQPLSLDFVLVPTATIKVELVDAEEKPIAERSLWLSGKELPLSSSILSDGKTDAQGHLQFENVPPNFAWWLAVQVDSRRDVRTPAMVFSRPESYHVRLRLRGDAPSGLDLLEVLSVKNAKGEEVRKPVMADGTTDKASRKAAPPSAAKDGAAPPSQP